MFKTLHLSTIFLTTAGIAATCWAQAGETAKPVKEPAKIAITASPDVVTAGSESVVTLKLTPVAGIKINRYPKVQLKVPALSGVVEASSVSIGDAEPPPPDKLEGNYFKTVDPLELKLPIAAGAKAGEHKVPAQLVYYYCVAASGFCAPAKVPVTIPITVR